VFFFEPPTAKAARKIAEQVDLRAPFIPLGGEVESYATRASAPACLTSSNRNTGKIIGAAAGQSDDGSSEIQPEHLPMPATLFRLHRRTRRAYEK
jgi:hypothetical protein